MTDDQVHIALCGWLEEIAGVEVIVTHDSGAAPAGAYIAVNMTTTRQIRQHAQNVEYEDADTAEMDTGDEYPPVKAAPVIEVEWQFSCHAYGPHPTDILRPVRSAIQIAQVQEPLLPSLVIHECSQIRNVPDWLNNAWEPRAQMDIFVRGLTRDGFTVDVIEEAPLDIDRAH